MILRLGYGNRPILIGDVLPPLNVLAMGYKAGVLSVTPDKAISILHRYFEVSKEGKEGWESRLCHGSSRLQVLRL